MFVIKNINANIVLLFNLAKIFFLHRELNLIIIEITHYFFILWRNSFWIYFYKINMSDMTPEKTLLIVIFGVD